MLAFAITSTSAACRTSRQRLGIADTTVKTHLSRLFEKTGAAARQAGLMKLIATYSAPLAELIDRHLGL